MVCLSANKNNLKQFGDNVKIDDLFNYQAHLSFKGYSKDKSYFKNNTLYINKN